VASYIDHNSKFCSIEKIPISKQQRIHNAPCPLCGVPLPVKDGSVRISIEEDVNDAFEVVSSSTTKPFWKKPAVQTIGIIAATVVVAVALGSNSDATSDTTSSPTPTAAPSALSQETDRQISRIKSMTDCSALQGEFDQADRNHSIQAERGNLELMKVTTAYMVAADNQMRRVGCYG